MMKTTALHQRGLTFISLTFVLGLIAFFTLLVLKIAPIYINHSKVVNALAAVEKSIDIATQSKSEIHNSLTKRFDMNYVEYVKPEDVTIVAQYGYTKVDIDYERVVPIAGNLSVLVQFHEGFQVGSK